jgi:uncharacterized protein
VGIEVKVWPTVRREDFRGLNRLASSCGEDFRLGVILYDGDRILPFGEDFFAALAAGDDRGLPSGRLQIQ